MNRRLQIIAYVGLIGVLALVLGSVFERRLSRDLYPPYSSFRCDPLGTGALHDALSDLPSYTVERSLLPLSYIKSAPPRTFLFLGVQRTDWKYLDPDDFAAIDNALKSGNRLVLCMEAEHYAPPSEQEKAAAARAPDLKEREKLRHEREAEESKNEKSDADLKPKAVPTHRPRTQQPPQPMPVNAFERWGFTIEVQRSCDLPTAELSSSNPIVSHAKVATANDDRLGKPTPGSGAKGLKIPDTLRWGSDLVVTPEKPAEWSILLERDGRPLVAERKIESGSIVVVTDAFPFSNEALQRARATNLLIRVLGENTHFVFEETHLGVAEDPGIATLARRYGLIPALWLCGLLAMLYIWKIASVFVPPPPPMADTQLDYSPTSSLSAILRRAVRGPQLLPTCLAEWRRTARPYQIEQVERTMATSADPVSGYNSAVAKLHPGRPRTTPS
jgi:hypothetical protein